MYAKFEGLNMGDIEINKGRPEVIDMVSSFLL